MLRGAVKCFNPQWTTNSEGTCLERVRRSETKAGGAKGIRYPCSPSCKHCRLDVAYPSWVCSVEAKALSLPPGEYGRKAETLRNRRGRTTRGDACGSI